MFPDWWHPERSVTRQESHQKLQVTPKDWSIDFIPFWHSFKDQYDFEFLGEMMKISHNYLGRYPFILNERFTNISANIEQAYKYQEMKKLKVSVGVGVVVYVLFILRQAQAQIWFLIFVRNSRAIREMWPVAHQLHHHQQQRNRTKIIWGDSDRYVFYFI